MNPLISIIIPVYNAESYINTTLESALGQTYNNIEVIAVDDGSVDNSFEILKEYENKYPNFRALHQNNMNASIARNRGIEYAKGDYFYFLDADDVAKKDAIEKLVTKAIISEADIVIGNMDEVTEDGEFVRTNQFFDEEGEDSDLFKFLDVMPAPPNKLYSAKIVRENDITFGNVRLGQDLNFYYKFLLKAKRIAFITDIVYSWRIVNNSMSRVKSFNLFDIVNSFKDIRKFYQINDAMETYNDYILMYEYAHYYHQMDKQIYYADKNARKLIIRYFRYHMKALGNLKDCKNYDTFAPMCKKANLKLKLSFIYATSMYALFYKKKNAGLLE